MSIKRMMVATMMAVILGMPCFDAAAAVSVTDVKAVQRYPWNGMVDIDYTIVCDDADADVCVYPNGVDTDRGNIIPMLALTGDGVGSAVKAGKHRMTWDAAKDAPGYNTQNFKVTMTVVSGASLYMVVDLSGGTNATEYAIRSSATGPDLTDDACRTTNLWLRLIPPGTFMMGSPETELGHNWQESYNGEDLHQVTITKPFYIGVFEVTQKQYSLVMGTNTSYFTGETRPVERVTYGTLRGTVNGAKWPKHNQVDPSSFFGKLRSKTALTFDLPTEAQWEYACRAGSTTALNSGKDLTDTTRCAEMSEVGRYHYNQNDGKGGYTSGHTKVGSYLPNTWGLYDMHGNVGEWCLDWWKKNLGTTAVTDPIGASSGSYRLVRGGCWGTSTFGIIANGAAYAAACRSAYRSYNYCNDNFAHYTYPNLNEGSFAGFRVACFLAE